jgi:O-antigen/teichoic acid export membrane protein
VASDARRLAANVAAGFAGRGGLLLLSLASVAISTRYLGSDGYGRVSLAFSLTTLFGVLGDAGLTTIVVRELARAPERAAVVVGSALTLRAWLALASVVAAVATALVLPYPRDVRVAVLIAGAPLALGLANSTFAAVLQAGLRGWRLAGADVAGRAAALAAIAATAALDLGFYAIVASAGVGAAVTLVLTSRLARPLVRGPLAPDRVVRRRLLRAALPLGAVLAVNEAYFRADSLIISLTRPFEELGQYALAWRMSELVGTVPAVLLAATFPMIASFAQQDDPRLRRVLQAGADVLVVAGAAIAVGGTLVAPRLAEAVGGDEFAAAAAPLRVLLWAAAVGFLSGLFGHALIARELQLRTLWLSLAALTSNVALNAALVPNLGIQAAAWVALGCEALLLTGSATLVRRHFGWLPAARLLPRVTVASAVMAAVVWPLRSSGLWLSIPVGATAYIAALAALGVQRHLPLTELRRGRSADKPSS